MATLDQILSDFSQDQRRLFDNWLLDYEKFVLSVFPELLEITDGQWRTLASCMQEKCFPQMMFNIYSSVMAAFRKVKPCPVPLVLYIKASSYDQLPEGSVVNFQEFLPFSLFPEVALELNDQDGLLLRWELESANKVPLLLLPRTKSTGNQERYLFLTPYHTSFTVLASEEFDTVTMTCDSWDQYNINTGMIDSYFDEQFLHYFGQLEKSMENDHYMVTIQSAHGNYYFVPQTVLDACYRELAPVGTKYPEEPVRWIETGNMTIISQDQNIRAEFFDELYAHSYYEKLQCYLVILDLGYLLELYPPGNKEDFYPQGMIPTRIVDYNEPAMYRETELGFSSLLRVYEENNLVSVKYGQENWDEGVVYSRKVSWVR